MHLDIKPITEIQEAIRQKYKETFTDKLVPFYCLVRLIKIIVTLLVGIWTLFKWLF